MKDNLTAQLNTFTDVCARTGKEEAAYAVPVEGTNKEKADACFRRLKLLEKACNGDAKVDTADTNQWKYFPYFRIVPDSSKPLGFGLSCSVYDCGCSGSCLGARPEYLKSEDAIHAGRQFLPEYEQWEHYQRLANQDFLNE